MWSVLGSFSGGAEVTITSGGFHSRNPIKGEIVIFNRSQYEDVLVVRVHRDVPKQTGNADMIK